MSIKKADVYIYHDDKVVFPYHEYTFAVPSNMYNGMCVSIFSGTVLKSDGIYHQGR